MDEQHWLQYSIFEHFIGRAADLRLDQPSAKHLQYKINCIIWRQYSIIILLDEQLKLRLKEGTSTKQPIGVWDCRHLHFAIPDQEGIPGEPLQERRNYWTHG